MKRVKLLVSNDGVVRDINGRFIFSAPMTQLAKDLTDDVGWRKGKESWLAYRNRTKGERIAEEIKKQKLAEDIAGAYNSYYKLD